jgi:hypothetical protein
LGGGIGFVVFALVQLLGMHWSTHRLAPFTWSRLARIYAIAALAALCGAASLLLVGALAGLILSGLVSIAAYAALLFAFERAQIHRSWRVLRGDVSLEAA